MYKFRKSETILIWWALLALLACSAAPLAGSRWEAFLAATVSSIGGAAGLQLLSGPWSQGRLASDSDWRPHLPTGSGATPALLGALLGLTAVSWVSVALTCPLGLLAATLWGPRRGWQCDALTALLALIVLTIALTLALKACA